MKSDGLVGILKAKIYSLEDLVRMSRYTIESLENEIKEIREQYRSKLTNQATQLKELYLMIRESPQDCENGHSRATTADMNFASDKEQRLQDEVERLKNEQITVRQQMTSLEIQIQQFRQNSQPSLMEHTDQLELLDTEDSDIDYSIHSFISLDHNNPSILEDSDDSWAEESIPTSTPKNDFRQVYRRKGHHKKSTPALSMASDSFRDETGNQDVRKGSTTSISRIDLPSEQRKNIVSESTNILNRVRYNDSPLKAERSSMPVTSSTLLSYVSDEVNTALTTGLSPRNSKPPPFTSISPPPPPPPHQDSLNESALNSTPIASTPPSIVTTPSLDESTPSTPLPSSSILSPGLPPPPPPPPPMSSHTSNSFPPPMPQLKPRKQLKWLPRSKVKQFPWEKIPDFAVERTVWSEKVKEEESLGEEFTTKGVFEEIEEIFSARAIEPIDHDTAKEEKAESKITVLNSKLTHNLMIILGRLRHLSSEKIREAILNLNENILTEILIRQFLQFMPSAEERGLLAEYKETPEKLAKADAFCAEMMKIDRYEQRLRAMHFKQTYFERYIALNEDLSAVLEASEALEKSHQFPKLLEIILVVGNFMNGTSFRGSAYGFKIHSINKLVDTKGKRNQITLLHFLVNTIEQRFPGILRFLDELNPVDAGCRVCFHEMKSNFKELNDQFEETQIEIEKYHSGPDKSQDPFTIQMRGFLASAGEQLSESQTKYERMHVTYEKIVKSYGEDPKTMTPEEFFGIFKSFMTSFEKALKDNRLRREQIERAEKRKHQENAKLDEPIAEKPLESELSVNPSPPTEEEKGVMDSLLDVLRRGNDFNAARRANRTEAISRLRDRDRRRTIRTYRRGSVHTRAKDLLVDLSSDKISRRNTSKSTLSIPALAEDN
ncbi:hypothetical protein K7432_013605 [Basidiobolus ranarum]|uniref:FH2 domain-containing protein n=1 Tax=Basidiobolus ranarum TaxID=34480 RepID=A0ABR2VQJ4_9FUNG